MYGIVWFMQGNVDSYRYTRRNIHGKQSFRRSQEELLGVVPPAQRISQLFPQQADSSRQ
jgi:hypothetical protein